jgi:two-component system CheB/CheR fusion protein
MPVHEAEDGMRVERNHVYVIPHHANMTIDNSVLRLSPRAENPVPYHPIDWSMGSLGKARRNHAIGVVLSGTGSDGTIGLKKIKGQGGITFAKN